MKYNFDSVAQGTIEYLVVLAVVVVISLIVIALFINITSSPNQQISSSSDKIGDIAIGGISIVEAVSDLDGASLIVLGNNSNEGITLKKISVGGVDNNYDNYIGGVDSVPISLSSLNSNCPCTSGQKNVKCEFVFEYLTQSGLTKIERRTINVECVTTTPSSSNPNRIIEPIIVIEDETNPIVTLLSPSNNDISKNSNVFFTFEVEENISIDHCVLNVGSDSNTYTGINNGENTIVYTFDNDALIDWNVSCVDSSQNQGVSSSHFLNVDFNLYQIKTCIELQDMNQDLCGNYILLNNIDCSADTREGGALYNGGLGFSPVGDNSNPLTLQWIDPEQTCPANSFFKGALNGNNFTIDGLNINRPSQNYVGLFGKVINTGLVVTNLHLSNVNIVGGDYTGGLIGMFDGMGSGGVLNKLSVDGLVDGGSYVGGLIGNLSGDLSFSGYAGYLSSNTEVYGSEYLGGLVGYCYNFDITKSKSLGIVSGVNYIGGLVGSFTGDSMGAGELTNSYSQSDVSGPVDSGSGDYIVGGLVGFYDSSKNLSNCYSSGHVLEYIFMFFKEDSSSKLFFAKLPPAPDSTVGGLVGVLQGNVSNSYYDSWTSEQNDEGKGIPKTTTEMKQQSTFLGWDFVDTWIINEGVSYPELVPLATSIGD